MFGKKNKSALVSHVDDSRSVVYDFRRRTPFESYRCMDYKLYRKLQEKSMYSMLDRCLDRLLPAMDDGNLNVLNRKLLALGMQGMVDLERQRICHQDTIRRVTARWNADHYDMVQMMQEEIKQLEVLLEEHRRTCVLADAYEKGEVSR